MEELITTEDTLFKVLRVLRKYNLTEQACIDAISDMQNSGVYFRENASAEIGEV